MSISDVSVFLVLDSESGRDPPDCSADLANCPKGKFAQKTQPFTDFNFGVNSGNSAGQTVLHCHFQYEFVSDFPTTTLSFPLYRKGRASVEGQRERIEESRGQASGGGVWGRQRSPQQRKKRLNCRGSAGLGMAFMLLGQLSQRLAVRNLPMTEFSSMPV